MKFTNLNDFEKPRFATIGNNALLKRESFAFFFCTSHGILLLPLGGVSMRHNANPHTAAKVVLANRNGNCFPTITQFPNLSWPHMFSSATLNFDGLSYSQLRNHEFWLDASNNSALSLQWPILHSVVKLLEISFVCKNTYMLQNIVANSHRHHKFFRS